MTKISVVTVCYNSEATINRCIQSVQSQGSIVGEHIIFDGGSTDNTVEIINAFETSHYQIKLTVKKDRGVYDALNNAISCATCEWIAILHSDDEFYDSTTLSSLINESSSLSNVLYSNLVMVRSNRIVRRWTSSDFIEKKISWGWMPPHPTILIKTKLAMSVGKYDLRYKIAADYDYCIRLFRNPLTKSQFINIISVRMQLGGLSTSGFVNRIRKNFEDVRVMRANKINIITAILGKKLFKIEQYFK